MKLSKLVRSSIGAGGLLLATAMAHGGTLSYMSVTDDASTLVGANPLATYTSAVDFTGTGSNTTSSINSIPFQTSGPLDGSGNASFTGGSIHAVTNFPGVNGDVTTGNIHTLLQSFVYGTPTTLTLTNLQPATVYTARFFVSNGFAGAGFNFTASDTGGAVGDATLPIFGAPDPATVAADQVAATHLNRGSPDASTSGEYFYTYTTGAVQTSEVFTFTATDGNNGFHSYGFSNESVPEPASLTLLSLGSLGLLARRRPA